MFNNKKVITIVVLISILLVTITAVNANEDKDFFNNIKNARQLSEKNINRNDTKISIGDRVITYKEFNIIKAGRKSLKNETDKDIENLIVRNEMLKVVSKDKGITVSKKEVLSYIKYVKDEFYKDAQSKELLSDYFDAYGLNEKTFWESKLAYEMYEDYLTQKKLREVISVDLQKNTKLSNDAEMRNMIERELDKLVEDKMDKVQITIK